MPGDFTHVELEGKLVGRQNYHMDRRNNIINLFYLSAAPDRREMSEF